MLKDYRLSLEKLAGAPPKRKAALIRSLLPRIEALLNSGHSFKDIWEALGNEGLRMTYHVFHMTVWRARKKHEANRRQQLGKQDKPPEPSGLQETEIAGGRNLLANLRLLEENRPGCDRFCLARIPGDYCGMFDVAGFKIWRERNRR